ncbi:MAG: hypothetical protein U0Q15_20010 [Kineosporiaceae bacterium]
MRLVRAWGLIPVAVGVWWLMWAVVVVGCVALGGASDGAFPLALLLMFAVVAQFGMVLMLVVAVRVRRPPADPAEAGADHGLGAGLSLALLPHVLVLGPAGLLGGWRLLLAVAVLAMIVSVPPILLPLLLDARAEREGTVLRLLGPATGRPEVEIR